MHATVSLLAALAITTTASAEQARGIVYHDRNNNGVQDAGEPGLPDVCVSNGIDVVTTDARGRYRLPVTDDTILFVVKPAGYQVPLDGEHKPAGHYIHKPNGSPDDGFQFLGVEPTGPLPDSIDFPLTQQTEPDRFTVVAFGDPQPYTLEQVDFYRAEVIDPLIGPDGEAAGASFGISLGDLVGDNLDLFQPLNQAQALFGIPWYNVYGNHDMNCMSGATSGTTDDPDRYGDETYERVYGPPNFAFQYGRVHFIVLDNVIWQGFDGFRAETPTAWPHDKKPNPGNYRGGLHDFQLRFVENYLKHVPVDDLVVLAFHIPMEMRGPGVHRIPQKDRLLQILSSHPKTMSLSGHTHLQQHWFFGADDGYAPALTKADQNQFVGRFGEPVHHHLNAVTASGSWYRGLPDEQGLPHTTMRDGAPNGWTLLTFDGASYTTDFRPARRAASDQMRIQLLDDDGNARGLTQIDADGADFTLNVFNGAEGDSVRVRVLPNPALGAPPTAWATLDFDPRVDPTYRRARNAEAALAEDPNRGFGMPNPQDCFHLWSGRIPAGLPAGTHTLEVRHIDLYGRAHHDRLSFRVTD